jgi:hypothetical protein
MESEDKVRVAVLDDGDHTTWCGDALIVELPADIYNMVVTDGDSKLLRNYTDKGLSGKEAVVTLQVIREIFWEGNSAAETIRDIGLVLKEHYS